MKKTYTVETELGTFKRTTKRVYTHAIVTQVTMPGNKPFVSVEWAGRADLAEKVVSKNRNGWSWQGCQVPPADKVIVVEL